MSSEKQQSNLTFPFIPSSIMSGHCVLTLLHDYDVNEVNSYTFKHKHDSNIEKETINVEKSGWTTIEILFNTV